MDSLPTNDHGLWSVVGFCGVPAEFTVTHWQVIPSRCTM